MKIIILSTILSLFFSSTVLAKQRYAKVINVTPVYEYLIINTPTEVCHNPSYQSRQHNSTNAVLGAIIGGTIGNAIGHNSKDVKITTTAGAVIGGIIGHELGKQRNSKHNNRQRCITSYEQNQKIRKLAGYNVHYRFKGRSYETFSTHKPGKKIIVSDNTRKRVRSSHRHSSQLAFQH